MMLVRSTSLLLVASVVVLFFACRGEPNDGVPCHSDDDCRPAPCGPCDPGATITRQAMLRECVANPCENPGARCSEHLVCVVR